MTENIALTAYSPAEIANLKVIGRTTRQRDPLTLFWTGSGIELCVRGTELWVEFTAGYATLEPWVSVFLNGALISRMMLPQGRNRLCIYRGVNTDRVNTVRILRETQAMNGDDDCFMQISSILTDGEFLEAPKRKYKLEFIGDSITSGEGLMGAVGDRQWLPMFHSVIGHYALLTAEALDADYSILSQGGYGVLAGWDNNPHSVMTRGYTKVCGALTGPKNAARGAQDAHDFAAWQPDAVVINLGTNDNSAFHQQAWVDPQSGERYQLRTNPDGTYHPEDMERFQATIVSFLAEIRRNNPHATIVWVYGMLGTPLLAFIRGAVDRYVRGSGDSGVHVLELPGVTERSLGSNNHPGSINHKEAADALTAFLFGLLPG